MSKHFYPAIFTKEEVGFSISFPDLQGCFSEGETLQEAYEMAKDAIGLYIEADGAFEYPEASSPESFELKKDQFVVLIEFDETEYLKKHSKKSVKKTLSIPSWLNTAAEKQNVNFSNILQNALIEQLHLNGHN